MTSSSDARLVARLLLVCEGLDGAEIADAVGVTPTVVSRWRNGAPIKYLHGSTRGRIEAILSQPGWKYVATPGPTAAEERMAHEQAAYAAGVLWSIAADAEHIARKAREAHAAITGIDVAAERPVAGKKAPVAKGYRPARPPAEPPAAKRRPA